MKVNVKKIFNDYRLDVEILARQLFPKNTYPVKALSRVFKNQALLNSSQLYTLAEAIGANVSDLYKIGKESKLNKQGGTVRVSVGGGGVAQLHLRELKPRTTHGGNTFYHDKNIPLNDYIDKIHFLIKNS